MKVDEKYAELIGIMLGDGCLCKSRRQRLIYISGHKMDDYDYHYQITQNLFKYVFNKNTSIKFRNEENTLYIKFSDKTIFNELASIGIPVGKKYDLLRVPNCINNKKLFCALVRGLFDTDGCVVLSKQHKKVPYYPRLEIASKSDRFLRELLTRLKFIGFYGSVSKKGRHFRLEIPGFKNLKLWMHLIGMNNPKHAKKVEKINSKRL